MITIADMDGGPNSQEKSVNKYVEDLVDRITATAGSLSDTIYRAFSNDFPILNLEELYCKILESDVSTSCNSISLCLRELHRLQRRRP